MSEKVIICYNNEILGYCFESKALLGWIDRKASYS